MPLRACLCRRRRVLLSMALGRAVSVGGPVGKEDLPPRCRSENAPDAAQPPRSIDVLVMLMRRRAAGGARAATAATRRVLQQITAWNGLHRSFECDTSEAATTAPRLSGQTKTFQLRKAPGYNEDGR